MIAELVMSASGMVNRINQWPAYRLTRSRSMRRGEDDDEDEDEAGDVRRASGGDVDAEVIRRQSRAVW